MKVPWNLFIFSLGYTVCSQLSARIFNEKSLNFERTFGDVDYISRFRYFEHETPEPSFRNDMSNYLMTSIPLNKNEMVGELVEKMMKDDDIVGKYKIKRLGKDEDDVFWAFGKIHGLENLAFVDE